MFSFMLTACSIFSPLKPDCIKEYRVDVIPYVVKSHPTYKTIAVSIPTANRMYQSKEMIYSIRPHEFNEFAKNRWVASPMQMLQPLIIQSLQNSHHYKAVAPLTGIGRFDFVLNTQLIDFYQEFCGPGSVFKLTMRAQMINAATGKIIASKTFTVVQPAPFPNPYGGVIAANQAVAIMLSELSRWSRI